MPAWARGRVKLLIFLSLLVAIVAVLASLLYFRAGPRAPQDADVVFGRGGTPGCVTGQPPTPGAGGHPSSSWDARDV